MKTSTFPTYRTSTDWSKLDQISEALAVEKAKLDNMGLEKMKQTLDRHRQFESDRNGPIGWLFRWFQTGR